MSQVNEIKNGRPIPAVISAANGFGHSCVIADMDDFVCRPKSAYFGPD